MKSEEYYKSIISSGPIVFNEKNIQCLVDQSIGNYYYGLIPKYYWALRPGRPTHITIVREWECYAPNLSELFVGANIQFAYYPASLKLNGRHFTIDCMSEQLENIRISLGLSKHRHPFNCFHFTVGYIDDPT